MTIKTLKKSSAVTDSYIETTWSMLSDFIEAVYALSFTSHSFQELYGACESACTSGRAAVFYDRLRARMCAHVASLIGRLLTHTQEPRSFLASLSEAWRTHEGQCIMLRSVFVYMDTTYVRDASHAAGHGHATSVVVSAGALPTLPLRDLGVWLFHRELAVTHPELLARSLDAFLACVNIDRDGETVDRSVLTAVCGMFMHMRVYESHVRPALITSTAEYYDTEGRAVAGTLPVPVYLQRVEDRIKQERERVHAFMDSHSTLKPVMSGLEGALLTRHAASLVDRGFTDLITNATSRMADLKRMYVLLTRAGAVEALRKAFHAHVKRRCADIVSNPDDSEDKDKTLVSELLSFRTGMDTVCTNAFGRSELFLTAVTQALEEAINSRDNKPAEMIAKFVDAQMRSGVRASASTEAGEATADLDEVLDRVMMLFRCIHAKDVFEAFYKKDLAKRLLLGRSSSVDVEKGMVARLKTECGSAFTSKLEGMFKDTDASADLMRQFNEVRREEAMPYDLSVHVLTSSYWPAYTCLRVNVPAHLSTGLETFTNFYLTKFSKGRLLTWVHALGHCILKAAFPAGKKELDVSFFQALVLLMYNDGDAFTCTQIRDATGIEDGECRRTLQSLALGQVRVLRKEPKGKDVADTDVFTFNAEFKAALIRLKINTIQMKETKAETDATHEQVLQERQYQIDAAIVRVMKARKKLTHTALLSDVFPVLRFHPKPADIKARIESLIDREYLERDDDEQNTYKYVA